MIDLAVHLTGVTARVALAGRDISTVYRILCAAGVTQARIAQATGQKQSEVSAILAGRRVQSIELLERIADGLGVPRGWMGLDYIPALGLKPGAEPETEAQRTANLLRHGGTILFGAPVFGAAAPITISNDQTPVPDKIGITDVERVASTTEQFGQLVGDFGGIPLTDAVTTHARVSEALLGATMQEAVRQRLLVALSDAHTTAGGAAAHAGLHDRARQHYLRGVDCAGAAGDMLRAVVNWDMLGCLELYVAPNDALKFFQLGVATAPRGLCRAMLEHHCALAYSLVSLAREALDELRRARDTYESASDELRPWPYFATALPQVEGRTYFTLGYFDRAAAAASTVDVQHTKSCTLARFALLAAAQLRSGEVRSGLNTAERAVSLAKGLRSVSVRDELAPLQAAAEVRRDSACQDLAREVSRLRTAA